MDLFKDVIKSILETNKDISSDPDFEKTYVSFIVNKALSQHYDCIFYANQMNILCQTDKKMQNDYLLNTIRSYKRPFQKWQKREEIENLEIIKEFFKFSNDKAREALTILTDEQISEIENLLNRGGVNNANKFRRSD
jgi:hypothetical protein